MPRMKLWSWQKENLPSIRHSVRTALAATASVIVARLVQMPEAYWAAIATLVVMQSTLGATLTLSIERILFLPPWVRPLEGSKQITSEQMWSHSPLRSFFSDYSLLHFDWRDCLSLRKHYSCDYC